MKISTKPLNALNKVSFAFDVQVFYAGLNLASADAVSAALTMITTLGFLFKLHHGI